MTSAHRPTFDPARGKEALRGPGFHQRLLPAHTQLKYRAENPDDEEPDATAKLLADEAAHFARIGKSDKRKAVASPDDEEGDNEDIRESLKRAAREITGADEDEGGSEEEGEAVEGPVTAKRQRVEREDGEEDEEEDEDEEDYSDDSEEDSDDEEAALQRELEIIRKERAEKKLKEAQEAAAREAKEAAERDEEVLTGNPLLNKPDYSMKRRWNDDVVFKNQARKTEDKKKEFVNDAVRSDFHRRFMDKYIR